MKGAFEAINNDELVRSQKKHFSVIPAKVPRQARDPELVERAGIQVYQGILDPGFRRGDGLVGLSRINQYSITPILQYSITPMHSCGFFYDCGT